MMDSSAGDDGGYKNVVLEVKGDSVYSKLKWEAGVHRVQRVPATETQGRVHTSTATVAIMVSNSIVWFIIPCAHYAIITHSLSSLNVMKLTLKLIPKILK